MSLDSLIHNPHLGIEGIADFLDSLSPDQVWTELQQLGRDEQRLLYEKSAEASELTVEDWIGEAPTRREVINRGVNTLPLPLALRKFEKRVCRPENPGAGLFGYNEGVSRRFIGPGYFVAKPTVERPHWRARGGVVVDYFDVPSGQVAAGWPTVVENSKGLQKFVFRNTRDFLRRVSRTVVVGAAYKHERPLDHYFVLCRQSLS
jgi:hypothetical protein